jgi:hypothetical protein
VTADRVIPVTLPAKKPIVNVASALHGSILKAKTCRVNPAGAVLKLLCKSQIALSPTSCPALAQFCSLLVVKAAQQHGDLATLAARKAGLIYLLAFL